MKIPTPYRVEAGIFGNISELVVQVCHVVLAYVTEYGSIDSSSSWKMCVSYFSSFFCSFQAHSFWISGKISGKKRNWSANLRIFFLVLAPRNQQAMLKFSIFFGTKLVFFLLVSFVYHCSQGCISSGRLVQSNNPYNRLIWSNILANRYRFWSVWFNNL